MSLSAPDIGLYAFALFVLFLTPGPVWVAMLARALSGGFASAAPLALGVVIGDVLWPLLAIIGVTWIIDIFAGFLILMRWVAVVMFVFMGVMLIRHAGKEITSDNRLTRPGFWAGFLAGLAVIIGNPKAILFYMGLLPGFFDLGALTWMDITIICVISAVVPFLGNLILAAFVGKIRAVLTSDRARIRLNRGAGGLLIAVAMIIPFT